MTFVGPEAKFEVKCSTCGDLIDGKGTTFEVIGACGDSIMAWTREVDISYDGETYTVELSYEEWNGYEWSGEVPDGLRELLDDMDLFDFDEQSRAMQNK